MKIVKIISTILATIVFWYSPTNADVLLVVGSLPLSSNDQAISDFLQQQGHTVLTTRDSNVTAQSTALMEVVFISSSVSSSRVGNKLNNVSVPIVAWEGWLFDNLGISGSSSSDYGYSPAQSINVINGSALSAGLTGQIPVTSAAMDTHWAVPGGDAIVSATFFNDLNKATILAYDTGSELANGQIAPARRIGLFLNDGSPSVWTSQARQLFSSAIRWATLGGSGEPPEEENLPPRVNAGNNSTVTIGSSFVLNASVIDDGDVSPTVHWNPTPGVTFSDVADLHAMVTFNATGEYTLELVADDGEFVVADTVTITVNESSDSTLLYVASRVPLSASDAAIVARLEQLGFNVQPIADEQLQTSSATGKDLILISSSINSSFVGNKLTTLPVPIITWEAWAFDDLKMTGSSAGNAFGSTELQTQINITSTHALSAGLQGIVNVTSTPQRLFWGVPEAGAIVVARPLNNNDAATIFAYEAGAEMADSVHAPARRFGFYLGEEAGSVWSTQSQILLDTAVAWALDTQLSNQPPLVTAGPNTTTSVGVTMQLNGSVNDDGITQPLMISWNSMNGVQYADINDPHSSVTFTQAGEYELVLTADDSEFSVSSSVHISVIDTNTESVLFVASSSSTTAADTILINHIEQLGYQVVIADDDSVTTQSATGMQAVFISSSTASSKIGGKFTELPIPVMTWHGWVFDDLALTTAATGSYGIENNIANINIDGSGVLTAGYSGLTTAMTNSTGIYWGIPGAQAKIAAHLPGDPSKAVIFGYESGTLLANNSIAPARRLGFFLEKNAANSWTLEAQNLFNAAVEWTLNSSVANRVKILPLGDSITHGIPGRWSYRTFLAEALNDDYCSYDFIGSMNGPNTGDNYSLQGNFDRDHEGHRGWRTNQIESSLPGWLSHYTPDWVLIHLGTNDILQERSITAAVENVEDIIEILRASNPNVGILLGQIIPSRSEYEAVTLTFNQQIQSLAVSLNQTGVSPVVLVDHYSGYDSVSLNLPDGIHPNAMGESFMAERWFEQLRPHLNIFCQHP